MQVYYFFQKTFKNIVHKTLKYVTYNQKIFMLFGQTKPHGSIYP